MTQALPAHGRLPWPAPEELDAEARAVHEAIAGGPRAAGPRLFAMSTAEGRLEGPFNAMLSAPSVGMALQELGAAIRYRTQLSDRCREIAILIVAAHHRSDYEWYAHEAVGRAAGLDDAEIAALRECRSAGSFDAAEQAMVDLALSLAARREVDDAVMERAIETLGLPGVTEAVVLIGYYETLDLLMRAWQTPLPDGVASEFGDGGGS